MLKVLQLLSLPSSLSFLSFFCFLGFPEVKLYLLSCSLMPHGHLFSAAGHSSLLLYLVSPQFLHSLGESLGFDSWHCNSSLVRVQHIYRPFGCLLGYSHVDSCLQDQILHGHDVLLLSGQGDEDVAVFQTRSPPPRW